MKPMTATRYRHLMIIFGALFSMRVLAQLASLFIEWASFPAFDRWYSGALSYPLLLLAQLTILFFMLVVVANPCRFRLTPALVRLIQRVAVVYFTVMFLRLLIALGGLSAQAWLQLPLPAFFHLVLAGFLYCYAGYHDRLHFKRGECQCTLR